MYNLIKRHYNTTSIILFVIRRFLFGKITVSAVQKLVFHLYIISHVILMTETADIILYSYFYDSNVYYYE